MHRSLTIPSREIIGGLCLLLVGVGVAIYAHANFAFGSLRVVGPGFLPFWLGVILAVCGVIIAAGSPRLSERVEVPELRPFAMIVLAILAFVVGIMFLGLLPAVLMLTTIAAFAQRRRSLASLVGLNIAALILAIGIFRVVLGIRFTYVQWPF
jgi:hypothetical protein